MHPGCWAMEIHIECMPPLLTVKSQRSESPIREGLSQAVEKAVIAYCVSYDEELDALLQSDEWHDAVIRNTLLAMSSMLDGLFIDLSADQ